jgi:hypothetical protein
MKAFVPLIALVALTLGTSCSGTDPAAPVNPQSNRVSMFDAGRITVHVYWASQGIPGKKVEVVGLGKIKTTDENGIAVFRVPVGTYTVRVYDVQRAGPSLSYVDTKVTVAAGGEVRVEVWECLPCV